MSNRTKQQPRTLTFIGVAVVMLVIGVAIGSVAFPLTKTQSVNQADTVTSTQTVISMTTRTLNVTYEITLTTTTNGEITHTQNISYSVTQTGVSSTRTMTTVVLYVQKNISGVSYITIASDLNCASSFTFTSSNETTFTQTILLTLVGNDESSSSSATHQSTTSMSTTEENGHYSTMYVTSTYYSVSATTAYTTFAITATLGNETIIGYCPPTNHP